MSTVMFDSENEVDFDFLESFWDIRLVKGACPKLDVSKLCALGLLVLSSNE